MDRRRCAYKAGEIVKVAVLYCAVVNGPITADYAARFVATWVEYSPDYECDLIVGCNGGILPSSITLIFAPLNAKFFPRSNEGWDIGLHQQAARSACADYDAVLWAGESVYFHRAGWLRRLVECWEHHGPGFYGPFSSNAVTAHLNTTAYFCAPATVRQYPKQVSTRADRYEYEHSNNALWRRAAAQGLPVRLVTWDGEYEPFRWRMPRNILWRGDQSNCLMFCNHAQGYDNANRAVQAEWARRADQPFR